MTPEVNRRISPPEQPIAAADLAVIKAELARLGVRTLAGYPLPLEPDHAARLLVRALKILGGPGSGNFGHAGRPGQVGGSTPKGGGESTSGGAFKGSVVQQRVFHARHTDIDLSVDKPMYFADVARSDEFGKNIVEAYINIQRPYLPGSPDDEDIDLTESEAKQIMGRGYEPSDFGQDNYVDALRAGLMDGHPFWQNRIYLSKLKKEGYDGVISSDTFGGKPEYVVLDPKTQVRLVKQTRALGGPGSGNFGHQGGEGGPGNPGGSTTTGFTDATAAQRAELKIPPAWTDVKVNPDPSAALRAVGRDAKGRLQYRYSAEHTQAAAAQKFERMKNFEEALPALRKQIDRDRRSEDPSTRESAEVLHLIDKTGFRVGGENELADVKAFGASTLQARHVKVNGDTVAFKFIGKKGVEIRKRVKDQELAKMVSEKLEGKSRRDPLFSATSAGRIRSYMKERAPDFTPKDFRTRHATAMALQLVNELSQPKTKTAFKKMRGVVGSEVAKFLGNTRTMALNSYIDPTVFKKWEAVGA